MIDETGKFIVQSGGQKKIFTHFKDLYVNRMHFEGSKKPVKVVAVDINTKPVINKNSDKFAAKHRAKINGQTMAKNIVQFLYNKNEVKNQIKHSKRKEFLTEKMV